MSAEQSRINQAEEISTPQMNQIEGNDPKKDDSEDRKSGFFWGGLMVVVGVIILSSQYLDLGGFWSWLSIFLLPILGVSFLAWGIYQREPGFLIPGGILTGLGTGVVLNAGNFSAFSTQDGGGIFMLSFAMGFLLITVLTRIFTDEVHWWPLIPASIMALVGLTVMYGGIFEQLLTLVGSLWPIALIGGGIYIIYKVATDRRSTTSGQ